MEKTFNIGRMKAEAMAKAFGVDIEKARHGTYEDNAENRRLNRVGQEYGKKAEEKQAVGKQPKQGEKTEQEKKTSAATMESAAQGASDEALKRASQDPKAPEDVKAAAKKELENRSGAKKEEKGAEEKVDRSGGMSVKSQVLKDFKKLSSEEMFKRGFDVWGAEENYMKEDEEGNVEIVSFQKDGTIVHDKVDAETGDEDMKEYKSEEEFMREFAPDAQSKVDEMGAKSAEADLNALAEDSEEAESMQESLVDYFHWQDEDGIDPDTLAKFKNIEKHYNWKYGKEFDSEMVDEEEVENYRNRMKEKGYIAIDVNGGRDYQFLLFKKKPAKKSAEKKSETKENE